MLCVICYLPATLLRTRTHSQLKQKQTPKKSPSTAHTTRVLFKGLRVRVGVSVEGGLQKSIYSAGQYIWMPLLLQPNSLSPSFTASYLERSQHKGNWYYIVRADINPWYFHCCPLTSFLPSLLQGDSHRTRGHTPNHEDILSDWQTKTRRKKVQRWLIPFFFFLHFDFVLSLFWTKIRFTTQMRVGRSVGRSSESDSCSAPALCWQTQKWRNVDQIKVNNQDCYVCTSSPRREIFCGRRWSERGLVWGEMDSCTD